MDLNRATLIGNVTRNPELRTIPSGQSVCSFGVATNMQWTDTQGQKQQRAEFHNVVAWGKLAEICNQYLTKGRKVYVEGRIQTREWEAQDGAKKNRSEIVADNMIILDRAPNTGTGSYAPRTPAVSSSPTEPTITPLSPTGLPTPTMDKAIGDQEIKLEDIPF